MSLRKEIRHITIRNIKLRRSANFEPLGGLGNLCIIVAHFRHRFNGRRGNKRIPAIVVH